MFGFLAFLLVEAFKKVRGIVIKETNGIPTVVGYMNNGEIVFLHNT